MERPDVGARASRTRGVVERLADRDADAEEDNRGGCETEPECSARVAASWGGCTSLKNRIAASGFQRPSRTPNQR